MRAVGGRGSLVSDFSRTNCYTYDAFPLPLTCNCRGEVSTSNKRQRKEEEGRKGDIKLAGKASEGVDCLFQLIVRTVATD